MKVFFLKKFNIRSRRRRKGQRNDNKNLGGGHDNGDRENNFILRRGWFNEMLIRFKCLFDLFLLATK